MEEAIYLYGFVSDGAPEPDALAGVSGAAIELMPLRGGVCAVVARVSATDYSGTALEERMQDLSWVAQQGVAHERVVAWFVDRTTILPVRLLTLYTGDAALLAEADGRIERLRGELDRLAGLREWDLKVSYRAEVLAEHLGEVSEGIAALDREIEAAPPGRRYLLEKKRADRVRVDMSRAARDRARELLDELASHARQVVVVPPPRNAGELPVVLAAALLVPENSEAALRDRLSGRKEELESLGFDILLSGPWAPYRFLHGEDEPAESDS